MLLNKRIIYEKDNFIIFFNFNSTSIFCVYWYSIYDEKFLVNTGYSKEAAKIIDIVAENPYREPAEPTKNIPRLIYHYIVPGQGGDIDFYNHSGNFDGWSWMDY